MYIVYDLCFQAFKADEVSVSALKNPQPPKLGLSANYNNAKDRAFAKLMFNSVIQEDVLKYRKNNPNWDLQIPLLLAKTKKKSTGQNLGSSASPLPGTGVNIVEPTNAANNTNGKPTETKAKKVRKPTTGSNSEPIKPRKKPGEDVQSDTSDVPNIPDLPVRPRVKKPVSHFSIDKSVGSIQVKYLKDLDDLEQLENKESEVKVSKPTSERKPKSSFFVGGVDEEKSEDSDCQFQEKEEIRHQRPQKSRDNRDSKPIFRKGKLVNKPFKKGQPNFTRNQDPKSRNPNYAITYPPKTPKSTGNFNTTKVDLAPAEKLHPSWEAKRKQQTIVPKFQGTKIKFDD